MFAGLGDTAENTAALIAFVVPGFLAISTFEAFSPSIARSRSLWHWTMWSLVVSLILVALMDAAYEGLGWPADATDPQFYGGLFGVAIVGGYCAGRLSGTEVVRTGAEWLGLLQPRWIWHRVVSRRERYVIVHLKDGSVIYGYPSEYTDDSREETREILLTGARLLVKGADGEDDHWQEYPATEAVLVESPEIKLIQLLEEDWTRSD